MKDLHTHILFGIDDGASNLDESIEMLKKLKENGVTDVMLTPHYISGSIYNCNNKEKEKIFKKIKKELKQKNINITLIAELISIGALLLIKVVSARHTPCTEHAKILVMLMI